MNTRAIVGVNMDVQPEGGHPAQQGPDQEGPRLSVPAAYVDHLCRAGAAVVLLPPTGDCQQCSCGGELLHARDEDPAADAALGWLDGVVLIGGDDPDPLLQGYHRTPWHRRVMPRRREYFDRWLIVEAKARRLPLLAIGAGMQLLNVVCGGTLSYEISHDWPKAKPHHEHGATVRHALDLTRTERSCVMGKIFCEGRKAEDLRFQEAIVSSAHHQAVDDVAPGFQATARSADGMVEAIESTNPNWFALGVQFHPHAALATRVEHLVFDAWVETVQRIALAKRRAARRSAGPLPEGGRFLRMRKAE